MRQFGIDPKVLSLIPDGKEWKRALLGFLNSHAFTLRLSDTGLPPFTNVCVIK